ncbi:MAG: PfkB family carbohydrate kinase [Nocardioides sp.]
MSVVVVGGCNVDVVARPAARFETATSNPGAVRVSAGGVGRNIAENLARLGTQTRLVSVVGDDAHADLVLRHTAATGVDVSAVQRVAGATGSYVALLDHAGELVGAVSDMSTTQTLDVSAIESHLAGADLPVLDGNLTTAALRTVWDAALAHGLRVVLDPVSVPKARAIAALLSSERTLHLLSAGETELAAIGGSAQHAEQCWIRRGAAGSTLCTHGGSVHLDVVPATVADVTGAGDAMLAAYCHAVLDGADPVEAATFGHAAAALTVASPFTVHPDLSADLVRSLL